MKLNLDSGPSGRLPHEFDAWGNPEGFPDARQRAQTIALCTENPGTPWFEQTCELAPQFAAAVSLTNDPLAGFSQVRSPVGGAGGSR